MSNALIARRERARASAQLRSRLLGRLALGVSVEAIAQMENMNPREVEKLLDEQLDGIAIRRIDRHAKLQIKRLEGVLARLNDGSDNHNVGAMAVGLKLLDRMDRYHALGARACVSAPPDDIARQRLDDKLRRMAARRAAPVLPPR